MKLAVNDLVLDYQIPRTGGSLRVLDHVTFGIQDREFVSVVGPSGCGKTTLLYCLAGLHAISGGTILFDGGSADDARVKRAVVFQSPTLLPWRNVADNVGYGLSLQGRNAPSDHERVAALIRLVGLAGFERYFPHALSGGMQQRVNLARALAVEPEVLLMDEPFAALDAQTRENMQAELLRVWEYDRKTVVFITHQIEEAVYLSDRVLVMKPRPSRVQQDIAIDLGRPRDPRIKRTPRFNEYVDQITELVQQPRAPE